MDEQFDRLRVPWPDHLGPGPRNGDHRAVIDGMPAYSRVAPEGFFGHYLMMMAGAIGGRDCAARRVQCSDYEPAVGTGQVDIWFDRPPGGWSVSG
jgi:3,4-dihydroxyphenylacetate 2,3-dioxygenase